APPELLEQVAATDLRVGVRTTLAVPLLRGRDTVGVLALTRLGGSEPKPFTDREIALAESFADQAVIAVENARLFRELQDQLEQQTATSRILEVIASSPTELQPVLDAVVNSGVR